MIKQNIVTDIRDAVAQREDKHFQGAIAKPIPARDLTTLKNKSIRPQETVSPSFNDPVNNIAMQNPTGQPGGGYFLILPTNKIYGQITGVMDKTAQPAPLVYNTTKTVTPSLFTIAREDSIATTNNKYFNEGLMGEGKSLFVENKGKMDFLKKENQQKWRQRFSNDGSNSKLDQTNKMEDGTSVTWSFTSLYPENNPIGSNTLKMKAIGTHTPTLSRETDSTLPKTTTYPNTSKSFMAY